MVVNATGPATGWAPSFLERRPLTRAAFELAVDSHAEQRREADDVPYVAHPIEAAALLHSLGYSDRVTAAALLHDTLEDTDVHTEQVAALDGGVLDLVRVLTDDESIQDERERKAALRAQIAAAGLDAAAIYAADKVSKVRELRSRLVGDETLADSEDASVKLDHYRESVVMLERILGAHALVELLRFEVEALDGLPPHGRFVR